MLGEYEKYVTETFGFDKVLPMNTGAEAVETALKVCRKWAYEVKGIPENQATIIVCDGNFHGRTTTIVSFSNDPDATKEFWTIHTRVCENTIRRHQSIWKKLLKLPNIAGFLSRAHTR